MRFKEKFGEDARSYADNSYDALFIIDKAIEIGRAQNILLKDALRLVKHDGLVGKYEFSEENSFTLGNSSLVCIRDGEVRLEN